MPALNLRPFLRFNTQPPEGGWLDVFAGLFLIWVVSTLSRPKAAGGQYLTGAFPVFVSTLSRPKAAGLSQRGGRIQSPFQHSAARRRLVYILFAPYIFSSVSTLSRPKAAGAGRGWIEFRS